MQPRARVQRMILNWAILECLNIPYLQMGNVDTLAVILDPFEMEMLAIYYENQLRWEKALDIGANFGWHSIIMARMDWEVRAFEPDPQMFAVLIDNLQKNHASSVEPINSALLSHAGDAQFVRVLGNLTASHVKGKRSFHGESQNVSVSAQSCHEYFDWADFAKIDAEGSETELVCSITDSQFEHLELLVEVGASWSARAMFEHCKTAGIGIWSQPSGWGYVKSASEMPKSHKEGPIFIGRAPPFETEIAELPHVAIL